MNKEDKIKHVKDHPNMEGYVIVTYDNGNTKILPTIEKTSTLVDSKAVFLTENKELKMLWEYGF
jgi:hypothetical protein